MDAKRGDHCPQADFSGQNQETTVERRISAIGACSPILMYGVLLSCGAEAGSTYNEPCQSTPDPTSANKKFGFGCDNCSPGRSDLVCRVLTMRNQMRWVRPECLIASRESERFEAVSFRTMCHRGLLSSGCPEVPASGSLRDI